MRRFVTMDELRAHMNNAQAALALEKENIHFAYPLMTPCLRPEYALAYVRAELYGLRLIEKQLAELTGLPLHLETGTEFMGAGRASLKRWMKTAAAGRQPDSRDFGNDFMHALTRAALCCGWESQNYFQMAARIAALFHDVACLVSAAHCCNELIRHRVESVALRAPEKLGVTTRELAELMESPELFKKRCVLEKKETKTRASTRRVFHVIEGGAKTPRHPAH